MDIVAADDISFDANVIVCGVATDLKLGPVATKLDEKSGKAISRLIDCKEITGKLCEKTIILAPSGMNATHLVVIGLGDDKCLGQAFRAAAAGVKSVTSKPRQSILLAFDDAGWNEAQLEAAVAGSVVGSSGQDLYREKKKRIAPETIMWTGCPKKVLKRGRELGHSVNLTRRLVNTPAGDMYPESFAEEALKVSEEFGIGIEIWDEKKLHEQRCESLLAVSRAAGRAPRLVIMQHRGGTDKSIPLALVGKGVTFDSGGLSMKSSEGMKTMKCDMAGAATVLGAMRAIAQQKLPVNVVGIMGMVENMVGPDSYKLGDVLKSRNGKTIEVLNTDAEGRLVLADALDVAVEMKAERIIDLATLTGACVVALGRNIAGMMTNNKALVDRVDTAAEFCGEPVWQLPMLSEFADQIRNTEIADIKNIGDGRWGGAITAGKFLEEFVSDVPWVHLDIAGPSFSDKPKAWIDGGGSGCMVRTLVEIARSLG